MASRLTHSTSSSSTGAVAISFAAEPVGGMNVQATLNTATSATIQVQVRIHDTAWLLADTITLPHPTTGATTVNCAIYPPYNAARWNITAIAGGSVTLDAIGVGL